MKMQGTHPFEWASKGIEGTSQNPLKDIFFEGDVWSPFLQEFGVSFAGSTSVKATIEEFLPRPFKDKWGFLWVVGACAIVWDVWGDRNEQVNGKKGALLKLILEKACDEVNWTILDAILKLKGFEKRWRGWIWNYLSSINFSIIINGNPYGKIMAQRGLRQGDPSPLSFLPLAWQSIVNLFLLGSSLFLNAAKNSLIGINLCDEKVASKATKEAWVALEDKFKTKIDKWRGLVRSKGSERFYFSRGLAYSGLRLGSGFDKPASYRRLRRFCREEKDLWRKAIRSIYSMEEHGWSSIKPNDRDNFILYPPKDNVVVAGCWVDSNQTWDLGARDSLQWKLKASSQFSTKSTSLKLTKGATKVNLPLVNLIWKLKVPGETKLFHWSIVYRSLNTRKSSKGSFQIGSFPLPRRNMIFETFGLDECLPRVEEWMMERLNGAASVERKFFVEFYNLIRPLGGVR
ncbi:DExH-box ATP-dependent RNA helicase DExH10-like [Cucumis melo var. makuwa]|uniref:DExH-box ATP-dependent RNA helicase DExH10-like n=1 Tax=Cucumis melo var. makuwa TaxID=1194695 RepID=A0A5D3DFZ0_CUCMM|nr:DExH-box ATP-dependent RNA helicase DExH10-like [Cucumis melo var. makuwa]TYK22512.1 DExH-box ATP-dependent RNA helicase DExH10-like [Cucumis melo var. makuwa]